MTEEKDTPTTPPLVQRVARKSQFLNNAAFFVIAVFLIIALVAG